MKIRAFLGMFLKAFIAAMSGSLLVIGVLYAIDPSTFWDGAIKSAFWTALLIAFIASLRSIFRSGRDRAKL